MTILRFYEMKNARNGCDKAISRTLMLVIFNQPATNRFVNPKFMILQRY